MEGALFVYSRYVPQRIVVQADWCAVWCRALCHDIEDSVLHLPGQGVTLTGCSS